MRADAATLGAAHREVVPAFAVPSQFFRWLCASYERCVGTPLVQPVAGQTLEGALWRAPRVIVSHGTQPDPIFHYGNAQALAVFEMDAESFCRLPSRLSAEPLARPEREALLARVARDGFIDRYSGVRISASGRRFRIDQAVVWNVNNDQGQYLGQAATFDRWTALPS